MACNQELVARIREALSGEPGLDEKKMFGGVGYLLNGNMMVGVWKDSLIVRLSPEDGQTLSEPHVGPFDITGRPMKGWGLVAPEGFESDDQLRIWIDRARRFVATLPAKTPQGRNKTG